MSDISKKIADLSPDQRRLLLQRLNVKSATVGYDGIPRVARTSKTFPLSFAQERIWFMEQMEAGTFIHNFPFTFQIEGPLDIEILRRALNKIVQRHETLRTSFQAVDGRPAQSIAEQITFLLPLVDMGHLSDDEWSEKVKQLSEKEAREPFDISMAPLLRATVFRRDDRRHALMFCLHHIISDTESIAVLVNELVQIYEAFCAGLPLPLSEPAMQYVDYTEWQRASLQGQNLKKELDYWNSNLAGIPSVLELPIDRPRPAVQTYSGDFERFMFSLELTRALKSMAQKGRATLFMTVLAAFKALLYRYTGQEKIVVGTPIANRYRVEIQNLIGLFLNNLVLCTDLSGDPSFHEILSRTRNVVFGAFEHQEMPFEKLVEEMQPERELSASPLFQVMFNQLNPPAGVLKMSDLKLHPPHLQDNGMSKYDLTFYLYEIDGRLGGTFEYNPDLFDAGTMARMSEHLTRLLEQVVAHPDKRLSELPLLTERENQLVAERNTTAVTYSRNVCFHHLFEAQAEKSPNAIAVEFAEKQVSYQRLNQLANRLAVKLREMNIGPDILVGICVERSIDMLVGLLAIHKAGGAYVPIDPAYPKQRLSYMLENAAVQVLLTQKQLLADLPPFDGTVLCLDEILSDHTTLSDDSCNTLVGSENLAYVIYTSGSTGNPKGVAISHRALVNFLLSMQERPGIGADDTLLAVTTLSFDIAGLELFLPLLVGGKVVIASREVSADARLLADSLTANEITVMQATPATWRLLMDGGWKNDGNIKMLCGGEALPRELANRLVGDGAELWNMYGPTETTIWSAINPLKKKEGIVSLGKPINNTQIHILDSYLQPVPLGVAGEVHIGGAGLATGYLHRPDLTAEKFIPDPFAEAGARMYRTGDLARVTTTGDIEFLGRSDHQVKMRGFRIELGEIEGVLRRHPAVSETAVMLREMGPGDVRIVAYNVYSSSAEPDPREVRKFVAAKLPDYMVPSKFVVLAALPLTPNGKIDRKALPAQEEIRPDLQPGYIAPQNEMERIIAAIWQDVLHVDKVGIEDNFFDLGGHSLLLVQVQSRLCERSKRDLSIIDLFKYPTVQTLTAYLTQAQDETEHPEKFQSLAQKQKDAMARQRRRMVEVKRS